MPTYVFKHPNGKTVKINGDTPPDEATIDRIFTEVGGKQQPLGNDPAAYPQGKSAAEAEKMRQQWIAQQSQPVTVGGALKKFGRDIINPSEPTVPASSLSDLTTRVLPESVAKLPGRLATGIYEGIKSQTDPIIAGLTTEFDNPQYNIGSEMRKGAGRTLSGLAEAVVKPTGLMGIEKAKEAWSTDPAGSLLAVAPMVKPTLKGIKAGTVAAAEAVKPISPEIAAKKINIDYQKAIRPSVKGTAGSAKQIAQSDTNSIRGVYDVVEAKNSGKIALGEEAEARLPQTLQEHLEAVNQAKMDAFTQYDSMKNATEGNGVVIDLQPIASTLRESAQNKALAISRPSVIQYMLDMADRFEQAKTLNPSEVQEAIKAYNSILDYSKATPEVAANAMVDKSIAAQLRKAIDDAITSDQGGGYGELKQKYGRLAQMEKEAAHRARVAGRAAPSSLFDGIMGGLTSAEIVSGLLTANPAQVARGGAMAAFKAWRNRMNSPDFQIKRMYKTAENATNPSGLAQEYRKGYDKLKDQRGLVGKDINAAWASKTKIVDDATGKPKRVYHGTTSGEFTEFKPKINNKEQLGFGIHFTEDKAFANQYAHDPYIARKGKNPRLYEVELNIENPIDATAIVTEGTPEYAIAKKLAGNKVYSAVNPEIGKRQIYMQSAIDATSPARAQKILQESGYDGVIYESKILDRGPYGTTVKNKAKSYIVFNPNQIRIIK